MATIEDVAKRAGVSISTVSRVFNGTRFVNPVIAERVRAAAQELNYQPSRAARVLRGNRSRILGLLITNIQNPFFTALVRGVEDIAHERGYSVILCNSDEDPQKERQYIEVLCAERVAGAILVPTREHQPAISLFHKHRIPVVAVDRRVRDEDVDAVLVDNIRGAREAVLHLISNGYRRIGIITGPLSTTTGRERLEGYRRALEEAGLSYDSRLVRTGPFKESTGQIQTRELLALDEPPEALFLGNNLIAIGALDVLQERGLRIPDDLALVSFDDTPWAHLKTVSLTTVAQPVYELGSTAALRLLQRLQTSSAGVLTRQEIVLTPSLRVRD
ncbi:MAG: LacI family DNA-binding transcriptional regulator, partial [Thermogemmatispora sp.]